VFHIPQQKRLRLLEDLMVGASTTRNVSQMLSEALLRVVDEMDDGSGQAAYVLEGEDPVSVGEDARVSEALVRLLEAWRRTIEGPSPQSPWLAGLERRDCAGLEGAQELCQAGVGAVLVVPLKAADRPLGYVAFTARPGELPETIDEGYWGALGRALGMAVDNTRLYQDVEQRLRRSQALFRVSRALSSTLNLDHVLSLIVSLAVDTIEKANNGVLHLLDEETGELHPRALSFQPGVLPDASGSSRMHLGQGVAGLSLQTGKLVNIPDVSVDPRFIHTRGSRHFASMAVAPLLLGERRIGTLSIDSDQVDAFDQDDEQLLMTLATLAAAAIDNARLVTDLQESLQDLKTTQQQLIQSAKLSAVGQLIAGVAHELNNPLTAVMGYAQLLQMAEGVSDTVRRDLEKVYAQARRAADIVENLITFARQNKQEAERVDVNEVLRRTLELRSYQLRKAGVDVVTNLEDASLGVKVQADHLQQVFLQLISNAQDALRETMRDRRLAITTERDGNVARIRFRDNGPGLSAEAEEHLFEPFFTTKEVGEGSGLGLSISFGIVNQYGGRIYAESERGKGATFVVEFPVVAEPSRPDRAPQSAPRATPDGLGPEEGRLILVAGSDDEVIARAQATLLQYGQRVVLARDARDAIETLALAHGAGASVDGLVVDAHVEGMCPSEFLGALRDLDPALAERVVFVAAADELRRSELLRDCGVPVVGREYDPEELTAALRSAISTDEQT